MEVVVQRCPPRWVLRNADKASHDVPGIDVVLREDRSSVRSEVLAGVVAKVCLMWLSMC